jgi:hypothetical protein
MASGRAAATMDRNDAYGPDEFSVLLSRLLAVAWGSPSSFGLDESAAVFFTACSSAKR